MEQESAHEAAVLRRMTTTLLYPTTDFPPHVTHFADVLSDSLVAMARYWDNLPGHANFEQSKLNYVAVVQPQTSLTQIRSAFGRGTGTLPLVIDDDLMAFAAEIVPVTAGQLQRGQWWGENLAESAADAPFAAQVASLAMRLMQASVLLASCKLDDRERHSAEKQLNQLTTLFEVDATLPVPQQFVACYAALETLMQTDRTLPQVTLWQEREESIACLPGVRAIYDEIDSAIFAVESAEALLDVDWETVQENFAGNFGRIQFTTTALLPLLAQHDLAVAFAIERYRLHWGQDLLTNIQPSREQLVRNAAQTVLRLYAIELPHGYIHADSHEALGTHIHNVQNEFLKVQFQYELLTMMCDIPSLPAPRLHVDRSLGREARAHYLRNHLREWLMLYQQLLNLVCQEDATV